MSAKLFRLKKRKGILALLKVQQRESEIDIPSELTHANAGPLRDILGKEPCFQCGSKTPVPQKAWWRRIVTLEVPCGELVEDGLKTLALIGGSQYSMARLTGKERFISQGLEGKACIRKPLFNALMNLDMIPLFRGRIVTRKRRVVD